MLNRGMIIAIVATSIVMYLVDFVYYSFLMGDAMQAMVDRFGAVAYRPDEINPALYFIPQLIAVSLIAYVAQRGGERSVGAWAKTGLITYGMFAVLFVIWWNLTFRGIPMSENVFAVLHDALWGGIAGAVLAFISGRLSKI